MSPFPSQTPDSHRPLIGTDLELQTGVRTERVNEGVGQVGFASTERAS